MPSIADHLDALFEAERARTGHRPSYLTVSLALGGALSPQAIQKITTGRIKDPRFSSILALARYFGVSPTYFAGPTRGESRETVERSTM